MGCPHLYQPSECARSAAVGVKEHKARPPEQRHGIGGVVHDAVFDDDDVVGVDALVGCRAIRPTHEMGGPKRRNDDTDIHVLPPLDSRSMARVGRPVVDVLSPRARCQFHQQSYAATQVIPATRQDPPGGGIGGPEQQRVERQPSHLP